MCSALGFGRGPVACCTGVRRGLGRIQRGRFNDVWGRWGAGAGGHREADPRPVQPASGRPGGAAVLPGHRQVCDAHWSAWQAARVEVRQDEEARRAEEEPVEQRVVAKLVEKTTGELATGN
jgi:hypothetical protein